MNKKKFKWGIIGLGSIAHKFAGALEVVPDAELIAVASRNSEKAKTFAQQYDAKYYYGSYPEIFKCDELDAVYVATPHILHCENTLMCLENKIPVLCEKPLAMNSAEVRTMVEASKKNRTFLMEAMWTRFLPSVTMIDEFIAEGEIGEIKQVYADFCFQAPSDPENRWFNQALGGGSLLDIGIYPVFFALHYLGYPSDIKAMASIGNTNVDEQCSILFLYPEGQQAVLTSALVFNSPVRAGIIGNRGRIEIHPKFFMPADFSIYDPEGKEKIIRPEYTGNGYNYEAIEVMKCVRKNKTESELFSHSTSMQLISLLDEIREITGIHYPVKDK